MNSSNLCTIDDVKKLTYYDHYKTMIDMKLSGKSLDEINYIDIEIINDLVIRIQLDNKHQIFLPIVATVNGHRALTRAEEYEVEVLEQNRARTLSRAQANIQRIDCRKARGIKESNFCLTEDDRRAWWNFLKTSYPRNYVIAQRYYAFGDDYMLTRLGRNKKEYTVNEYFEIYGLPRIFTDQNHNIQVINVNT